MTILNDVFLVEDLVKETGYNLQHVRRMLRAGLFPGAELRGRVWLVPRSGLDHFKANPPKKPGRPVSTGAGLARNDRRKEEKT